MKRVLFILSFVAALFLASCSKSTKYDGEKAYALCKKCQNGNFSENEATRLLAQYEAAWDEFVRLEKNVAAGDRIMRSDYHELNKAIGDMCYALEYHVGDRYPDIKRQAREIEADYLKQRDQ